MDGSSGPAQPVHLPPIPKNSEKSFAVVTLGEVPVLAQLILWVEATTVVVLTNPASALGDG